MPHFEDTNFLKVVEMFKKQVSYFKGPEKISGLTWNSPTRNNITTWISHVFDTVSMLDLLYSLAAPRRNVKEIGGLGKGELRVEPARNANPPGRKVVKMLWLI
nr:hypothetical protein Iba_chr08cCG3720 [Ipomoea batatas]